MVVVGCVVIVAGLVVVAVVVVVFAAVVVLVVVVVVVVVARWRCCCRTFSRGSFLLLLVSFGAFGHPWASSLRVTLVSQNVTQHDFCLLFVIFYFDFSFILCARSNTLRVAFAYAHRGRKA